MKWLTFEVDTEPYALKRDAQIEVLAKEADVQVETRISHTLYNVQRVIQVKLEF